MKILFESKGVYEPDNTIPLILFFICTPISILCFWVAGFDWAMWFWKPLGFGYGLASALLLFLIAAEE